MASSRKRAQADRVAGSASTAEPATAGVRARPAAAGGRGEPLLEQVRRVLRDRIAPAARLAVALSGGLDSVVLLHLLHGLRTEQGFLLSAVHVHHGLSPHADSWAEFCATLCQAWDVPLRIERVQVERDGRHGLEAAARQARYRIYAGLPVDFVVLAHQQDDQVETVLLNLLRGTGVVGMAAMPVVRTLPDSQVRLLRPLLQAHRAQIERYARAHGLAWVEDESNRDTAFARNHLRQAVLPVIAPRFPAYRGSLSRAARHFAECAALLAELARLDARGAVGEAGLELAALSRLPRARAKNLLRWYLGELGQHPWPEARLESVLDQLLAAGPDNRIEIRAADRILRVWRGHLRSVAAGTGRAGAKPVRPLGDRGLEEHGLDAREGVGLKDDLRPDRPCQRSSGLAVAWHGEDSLAFAGGRLSFMRGVGEGISLARLASQPVIIRTRMGGERLKPDCNRPRRTLKQLCQERAIPPWERDGLPLLYVGTELAWVAGLGTDCAYRADRGEAGLVIAWHPERR